MNRTQIAGHIHLRGDVVEVIYRDGKQWARIQIRPPIIEIGAEILKDAHLGDEVEMDAAVAIQQRDPEHL